MRIKQFVGLALLSFVFLSCSKDTKKEELNTENISKTQSKPGNLITLEDAKEQIENYNTAHPEEVGENYAMRTWISIEELKAYIQYIEKESKDKGIEVSGIDFIHTQHNKAKPGSKNPLNEIYNLTLMLAPTFSEGNAHVAFDPIYSEEGMPKKLEDLLDEVLFNIIEDGSQDKPEPRPSSIGNNLNSCPSFCN